MEEKNLNEMEKFRKKMKRKRRKRMLRFAFLSLLITVVACAAAKLFFSVSSVKVYNPTPYDTSALVNAAGVLPGRVIFTLNEERIQENLRKSYPYVRTVTIDRKLPSTITVSFHVSRCSWRLESNGEYIYLSDDMVILEKSDVLYEDTVKVTGMEIGDVSEGEVFSVDDSIEFKVLGDIIQALDSRGMRDKLTCVDFTKKYNTKIYLGDRVEVELGTSEAIAEKIDLMLKILDRNSPEKKLLINVKNPEKGRCREISEPATSGSPDGPSVNSSGEPADVLDEPGETEPEEE